MVKTGEYLSAGTSLTPSNARVSMQVSAVSSISGMFTLKTLITSLDIHLFPAWQRGAKDAGSRYLFSQWK
jgi:hypothetical protein